MSPRQQIGVVIGLVVDVDDPEGLGRIKVSFPWLSDDNQSQWARLSRLMAGNDYGTWFMPEVDDEVLLALEVRDETVAQGQISRRHPEKGAAHRGNHGQHPEPPREAR